MNKDELYKNLESNCIPDNIYSMKASDYEKFLQYRRRKMAEKIKKYYYSI